MKAALDTALHAHTNLNLFAAVQTLLESGCLYGGLGSDTAAAKIIKICRQEQARLLTKHDRAVENMDLL